MDEIEWRNTTSPQTMLKYIEKRMLGVSERKLTFFALHCCRLAWPTIVDAQSRAALEVVERHLCEQATSEERSDAILSSNEAREASAAREAALANTLLLYQSTERAASQSASLAARVVYRVSTEGYYVGMIADLRDAMALVGLCKSKQEFTALARGMCALLHELFGNPFRPVTFPPEWRTDTAMSLARGMYDSRDFSAMPILADALQDAGCDSDDILNHCRDTTQVHVRGCWVVDLLLGK